jgi:hypothetical protein
MKKILLAIFIMVGFFVFTACNSGIPDDATIAVCPQGQTFKYVYKEDKIYEFYTDDVLQNSDMLKIAQNAADNYDNVKAYLDATFLDGVCTFTSYTNNKE